MRRKTLLSWSSGKDSAWALHILRQDPCIEVVGLFCTINQASERVIMHGISVTLLQQQAKNIGLPLYLIKIPHPCNNHVYASAMTTFLDSIKKQNIEYVAFGDLFLEEIRKYREDHLKETGVTPIFPLWGIPTRILSREMITSGLQAITICIDPKRISDKFAGRMYNESFLKAIPNDVDPCGEYGEFHTFVFDGPMFEKTVEFIPGETVHRDGFVFTDLIPLTPDALLKG